MLLLWLSAGDRETDSHEKNIVVITIVTKMNPIPADSSNMWVET